jgi:hypothetical protein
MAFAVAYMPEYYKHTHILNTKKQKKKHTHTHRYIHAYINTYIYIHTHIHRPQGPFMAFAVAYMPEY